MILERLDPTLPANHSPEPRLIQNTCTCSNRPESESERALIPSVFTHTSNLNDSGVFVAAGIFTLHNILFKK